MASRSIIQVIVIFSTLLSCLSRTIDLVTPLAAKDASIYRFNLRHALKHIKNVRNVYVICRPSKQMYSLVKQANDEFTTEDQKVILVDEGVFPFSFDSIRSYLRENRPTEGFDGKPFDCTVVVPQICSRDGPKGSDKSWIHACRQPFANETNKPELMQHIKVQSFDRTGWMLQQFIKLGCTEQYIPGIGDNYYVLDADTIFFNDYDPIYHDDPIKNNYMPGDPRDCANPPYFMVLDALGIPVWSRRSTVCAGRKEKRRCKQQMFCPIAHGMVYSQRVLAALHKHIEDTVKDSKGNKVEWWQGVLQAMTSWHTSPFSEYITYFAFAENKFPETVQVYDTEQIGASEDEISPNYYMSNGMTVSTRCNLVDFASKSQEKQDKAGSQFCSYAGGKSGDACALYDPAKHDNVACPAPKYESFHGFRNAISPVVDTAFQGYDLRWLAAHGSGDIDFVTSGGLLTKLSPAELLSGNEGFPEKKKPHHIDEVVREDALEALDAKLGH